MFVYFYMYSVCVNLWKAENEVHSTSIPILYIKLATLVHFDLKAKKKCMSLYYVSHDRHKTQMQFFVLLFVLSLHFLYSYYSHISFSISSSAYRYFRFLQASKNIFDSGNL